MFCGEICVCGFNTERKIKLASRQKSVGEDWSEWRWDFLSCLKVEKERTKKLQEVGKYLGYDY